MALTQLRSNNIVPKNGEMTNPGWVLSEQAEPEASVFVEKIHDRTGLIHGISLYQTHNNPHHFITLTGIQLAQAEFVFNCTAFTNATGFEVEWVNFHSEDIAPPPIPPSDVINDCGLAVSPLASARHTMDLTQNNILYIRDVTTGLEHKFAFQELSQLIPYAYFTFTYSEMLEKFKSALEVAMTKLSVAPTFSEIYMTTDGHIAFFFEWAGGAIEPNWSEMLNSNVCTVLRNYVVPVALRENVTYGTHTGFALDFDMGVAASQPTFPNGTPFITLHSPELTAYRKNDCVMPNDGDSHIATIFAHFNATAPTIPQLSPIYRKCDQSLVGPKIAFQKIATVEEFRVMVKMASIADNEADAGKVLLIEKNKKCYMNLGLRIT